MVHGRFLVGRCCCDICNFSESDYSDGLTFSWNMSTSAATSTPTLTEGPCKPFGPFGTAAGYDAENISDSDVTRFPGPLFNDFTYLRLRENVVYEMILNYTKTTNLGVGGNRTVERADAGVSLGDNAVNFTGVNGVSSGREVHAQRLFTNTTLVPCTPNPPGSQSSIQDSGGNYETTKWWVDNNGTQIFEADPQIELAITLRREGNIHYMSSELESKTYEGCELPVRFRAGLQNIASTLNKQDVSNSRNDATSASSTFSGSIVLQVQ